MWKSNLPKLTNGYVYLTHYSKTYPKSGTRDLGLLVGNETQDPSPRWDPGPETRVPGPETQDRDPENEF